MTTLPETAVLQCVWPITDDRYTRTELIAEATPELSQLTQQTGAVITGPVTWRIAAPASIPEWADYPGSLLVAEAPAVRVSDQLGAA